MANAYFYSNIAVPTTLSGNINNSVTSCTVADTTGWPASTPYIVALDYGSANEELVKVTANAAGTLTIQRGFGGTSAVSHSTGAVVRHVYNSQDATDFRTHEQATSGAHGIAGSFVGTTDSQTLTNKTLTAPAISNPTVTGGGSLAGTFAGTPTFSGAVVLSGTPSISNGAVMGGTFTGAHTYSGQVTATGGMIWNTTAPFSQAATSTTTAFRAAAVGDATDRFQIRADGRHDWGDGTAARDVNLYRASTNLLQTDDAFQATTVNAQPSSTLNDAFFANLPSGTSGDLLNLRVNSAIQAAMGNDGAFRIYGGNAPTSYTPTWGGTGGATFGTNTGYYWKMGKIVFLVIYASVSGAGSGSTAITVTAPSNIDRTTRQTLTFHGEVIGVNGSASKTTRGGECVSFTSGSTTVFDRIRVDDSDGDGENNVQGSDLGTSTIMVIQGWYREA